MTGFTIYRDSFLSGWGRAPRGSYVVVGGDGSQIRRAGWPWPREEFRKVGEIAHMRDIRKTLLSRGRHVEAWHLVGDRVHKFTLANGDGRGSGRTCGSFFDGMR